MTVIEKVKYQDGREVDHNVEELSAKGRNKIISTYLDVNSFMKSKNTDNADMTNFVKEGKDIFDFMEAILESGMEGIELDKISGKEMDRLFEKYMGLIMGFEGDTKN